MLRLRPQSVGSWIGAAASEWVDGRPTDVRELGRAWRPVAEARTEAEMFEELAKIPEGADDPMVVASVARLKEARPPAYPEIAREMGYSYEQWRRRMKSATGVSPKFLARYYRLQRASRLARAKPSMSMGEIAFRTGYATDCLLAAEAASISGRTFRGLVAGFTLPE